LVRRVLANRVLLWIGLVSYALFLWHAPIIAKLADLGALDAFSAGGFIAAAFGVSLLVAAGSFYAVERPAMRLGRRLSRRAGSQDADVRMRDLARHERAEPGAP
jgi:peptidoglycan/LPS O-acetylase OafA/YrhL